MLLNVFSNDLRDGKWHCGFDILTALDVAGHEIGHASLKHTTLTYQNVCNERRFSDIWEFVLSLQQHQQKNQLGW
jgi:Zn-dependent metalloprotease